MMVVRPRLIDDEESDVVQGAPFDGRRESTRSGPKCRWRAVHGCCGRMLVDAAEHEGACECWRAGEEEAAHESLQGWVYERVPTGRPRPFGNPAVVGSFVASEVGVAEESEDPWLCGPGFRGACFYRWSGTGSVDHKQGGDLPAANSAMTTPARYYVNPHTPAWGVIPMLRLDAPSTPTLGALAENQVRLLDALARPILVADETGRLLYQTPALRECLDHASAQERSQLSVRSITQ